MSLVSQDVESTVSAVYECKRLFYLILQNKKHFFSLISKAFENREKKLNNKTNKILKSAKNLLIKNKKNLCKNILNSFSSTELKNGLKLVQTLSKNIETSIRKTKGFTRNIKPKSFDQIW